MGVWAGRVFITTQSLKGEVGSSLAFISKKLQDNMSPWWRGGGGWGGEEGEGLVRRIGVGCGIVEPCFRHYVLSQSQPHGSRVLGVKEIPRKPELKGGVGRGVGRDYVVLNLVFITSRKEPSIQ